MILFPTHHMERSRLLAEAIGYARKDICVSCEKAKVFVRHCGRWREFDYRDTEVICPIAERYNLEPFLTDEGSWRIGRNDKTCLFGESKEHCITEAMIEAHWWGVLP